MFWYDNFEYTPRDKRYRDSRTKKIGSKDDGNAITKRIDI